MSKDTFEKDGEKMVRTAQPAPPMVRRKHNLRIPIGIEKVLVHAASDAFYRRRLLEDRQSALTELAGDLSETERAVLAGIPADSLAAMVTRIDLKQHARSRLMRGVMAATLLVSSVVVEQGCGGVEPDLPADVVQTDEHWAGGHRPGDYRTEPPLDQTAFDMLSADSQGSDSDVIEVEDSFASNGILPTPDAK